MDAERSRCQTRKQTSGSAQVDERVRLSDTQNGNSDGGDLLARKLDSLARLDTKFSGS